MKFNIVSITVLIAILACGTAEDEESLQMLAKGDTYDDVRSGARLILNYDAATRAFVGTVENTTSSTLQRVRVEVHLSNGTELGPTMPTLLPLPPGEKMNIKLDASGESFSTWSAHVEFG